MSADVIKMAAASDEGTDGAGKPREKLEWEGREVEPRHLPLSVYEEMEAKGLVGREGLWHILLHSLHYMDGSRVFKERAEISKVPHIHTYRLLKLAVACGEFNKPPDSENPLPNL